MPQAPLQVTSYVGNSSITSSTRTSTKASKAYIQPYLNRVQAYTKNMNLKLNPDKTTCNLFTPDHAEYNYR